MFLKSLFAASILYKKAFAAAAGIVLLGVGIHYGVATPIQRSQETTHLIGSQPLLESYKGNPYHRALNEAYSVSEFKRTVDLPPLSPALSSSFLSKDTKASHLSAFNSDLRKYVEQNIEQDKNKKYEATILETVNKFKSLNDKTATISEIEIPYKSYLYNKQVRDLDKPKIVQDLLWSLAEESAEQKTIIRPDSIQISFTLEKISSDIDVEFDKGQFPLAANKLHNLRLRFKAYNPNNDHRKVLKSLSLLPFQETDILISIDQAEIRPFVAALSNRIKWGLLPVGTNKFEVTMDEIFPSFETKKLSLSRLSFLKGPSKFIYQIQAGVKTVNTPTYQNFSDIVTPSLSTLTPAQVKKDIEIWYGAYSAYHLKLRIEDILKLIDILDVKIFRDAKGVDHSGLEMMVSHFEWRNNLYSRIRLKEDVAQVLESFFAKNRGSNQDNPNKISLAELTAFLKSMKYQLSEMKKNIEISVNWVEEPKLSQPDVDDNSPFQAVSFKLKQTIKWTAKSFIPFKGCWSGTKFEEAENKDACKGDGKTYFDFSDKLKQIDGILTPLKNVIGAGVFNFIPDANQFIGWEKWEIDANEEVTNIYTATKSPIRPAVSTSYDFWEKRDLVPGWKAIDVSVAYDLSKFHKFYYKIYQKLDAYRDTSKINLTNPLLAATGIAGIKDVAKKNPISLAVHLINSLFTKDYFTSNQKREIPEENRPWPVFFKTLLSKPLTVESSQMFVGYSSTMFNVEDWVLTATKATDSNSNTIKFKLDKDWQKKDDNTSRNISDADWDFPATYRRSDLKELMKDYMDVYSMSFPRDPMIFEFDGGQRWQQFLGREGSTTHGMVSNRDLVKNIIKEGSQKSFSKPANKDSVNSFPSNKFINWNKVKLSFTQIEMEAAIKSVLALKNQLSGILSGFVNLKFSTVLGEALQRDAMLITVNMMLEDGSAMVIRNPLTIFSASAYSLFRIPVAPNIDKTKLDQSVKNLIGA